MESAGSWLVFRCTVCSSGFTRLEHLQRHTATHTGRRPFCCTFCTVSFTRRDTLIRHWKTCEPRLSSGNSIPNLSQRKRGRKQNACDRCAQMKVRCSQTLPCNKCNDRKQECTYNRFLEHVGPQSTMLLLNDSEHRQQESVPSAAYDPDPEMDIQQTTCEVEPIPSITSTSEANTSVDALQDISTIFPLDQTLDLSAMLTGPSDCQLLSWMPQELWNICDMIAHPPSPAISPSIGPVKLGFLEKFTSTHGMANSFDCGSSQDRKRLMLALAPAPSLGQLSTPEMNGNVMLHGPELHGDFALESTHHDENLEQHGVSTDWFEWGSYNSPQATTIDSTRSPRTEALHEPSAHPLEMKMHEIVLGIQKYWHVNSADSSGTAGWTPQTMMLCYRFFSPDNLDKYLLSFWSFWHPNWPVFHKPTFDSVDNPARLLASLALIGACLMTDDADRDQALFWIAAVEEWVFSDASFSETPILESHGEFDELQTRSRLNALRAAYCVVLVQSWEGSGSQKRRARRSRFTQIVAVARSFGPSILTHRDLSKYARINDLHRNWTIFILKEELIRTVTFVFLLDTGYVIFNNTPPRMMISELEIGLTCPEPCFQAVDAEGWLFSAKAWSETYLGQRQPSISTIVEVVMKDAPSSEEWKILKQMSSLNFFTVASAFHSLIFHHHGGPSSWNQASLIRHGLGNWRQAWLSREPMGSLQELEHATLFEAWRKIGFMRYAMEFWYLGCIVYKRAESTIGSRYNSSQGSRGPFKKGFLEAYDNSDMEQVHELIVQFHKMNLGMDIL